MELYLLRHAIAAPRGAVYFPNDDRPLTQVGIDKMKKGAEGIRTIVPKLDVILTSPLKRASGTANIVATALGIAVKVETRKQLSPDVPAEITASFLEKLPPRNRVMIVGHEPNLSLLASFLLGYREPFLDFKKGALCRIDLEKFPPRGKGKLLWHLTPKQLRLLGKNPKNKTL